MVLLEGGVLSGCYNFSDQQLACVSGQYVAAMQWQVEDYEQAAESNSHLRLPIIPHTLALTKYISAPRELRN